VSLTPETAVTPARLGLRGHVVAFFPREGAYELRAVYAQQSWMNVGERHRAQAAPFSLHLLP
jgi:hypothetical protein